MDDLWALGVEVASYESEVLDVAEDGKLIHPMQVNDTQDQSQST